MKNAIFRKRICRVRKDYWKTPWISFLSGTYQVYWGILEWKLELSKFKEEKKHFPNTSEELKELINKIKNVSPEHHFKEILVKYIEDMEKKRKDEGRFEKTKGQE